MNPKIQSQKKREVDDADEQEESTEPEILRDEDFDDNVLEDEEEEQGSK